MIEAVTMYRVACDRAGCSRSAADGSEYVAWTDTVGATEQAERAYWFLSDGGDYCPDHRPLAEPEGAAHMTEHCFTPSWCKCPDEPMCRLCKSGRCHIDAESMVCDYCKRRVYEAKVYSDGGVICRTCFTKEPQPGAAQ